MAYSDRDRLIALAGIYQAVHCVMRIARHGSVDTAAVEPCLFSLFQVDADNVASVFGPPGAVSVGARKVIEQMTNTTERDMEPTRYVITLMKLEQRLAARPDLLAAIRAGIDEATVMLEHHALLDPAIFAHMADIYAKTISSLPPRIMVRGEPLHLNNPDNQNRIRALLLAGIRGAMLWRQTGGSRWQIIFGRRRLFDEAQGYLRQPAVHDR
ncbi:high frequency lysogenization protein HflD [Thiococcus pfennigii]|jgi:high frequency lysogenization protein|uniref:high frequency lysogenization protein HflD n=1 Tax=Thiococcus pfennigii TaxID=1057 RepID=UPI001903F956|nr:high frequency lysogenization protein HflD [Thiococcus pfennigii]MBK1702768.1 lysogenization regulator HflD [Thiococcus pfennigii]MBK1733086.1 lysogenization regulator HflD [Thiococcus pfennigii]